MMHQLWCSGKNDTLPALEEIRHSTDPALRVILSAFKNIFIMNILINMCLWRCACEGNAHSGQKRVIYPLELELQAIISYPRWELGKDHGAPMRVVCILNHWGIYTAPFSYILTTVLCSDISFVF